MSYRYYCCQNYHVHPVDILYVHPVDILLDKMLQLCFICIFKRQRH